MSRVFPYPLLTVSLIMMWLLLSSFSLGQFILGTAVALVAAPGDGCSSSGQTENTAVEHAAQDWPRSSLTDILRSNIAVAWHYPA